MLEVKVPPVALAMAFGLIMWSGSALAPAFQVQIPLKTTVARMIGLLGVLIAVSGVREFKRAKTTVNPTKPQSSSSLVTTGIYRRTRNPMYLGFLLILIGWAIAIANPVAFVVLPGFVVYMNRFQIKPEERALTSVFGDDFKAYCIEARRWI